MTTTSPTTTIPATGTVVDRAGERPVDDTTGAGYLTTAVETSRRTILQFFRTPQLLMMGTIQGAMFLLMFRYVFGGAISTRGDLSYVDFMVPGFLVTTILWTGMGAAAGVAEDGASGVFDRLRSLPIPRSAVVLGRSLADVTLMTWGFAVTSAIGFAVGFRTHANIGAVILAFLLMILAGYAFTWVFITIGLVSGSAQAAQGMGMLVVPFSFISSANVPVESMPGWLQPFAANQPMSVIINAVRSLMFGGPEKVGGGIQNHSTGYWVVLSLVWCTAILLVFGALSTARFSRSR